MTHELTGAIREKVQEAIGALEEAREHVDEQQRAKQSMMEDEDLAEEYRRLQSDREYRIRFAESVHPYSTRFEERQWDQLSFAARGGWRVPCLNLADELERQAVRRRAPYVDAIRQTAAGEYVDPWRLEADEHQRQLESERERIEYLVRLLDDLAGQTGDKPAATRGKRYCVNSDWMTM